MFLIKGEKPQKREAAKTEKTLYYPSSVDSWMTCSAYSLLPETPVGPTAELGIKLHKEAEEAICLYLNGGPKPSGENYANFICDLIDSCPDGTFFWVEESFYDGDFHIKARVDFAYYAENQLTIIDLKTGDYEVHPQNNKQLMLTAALLIKSLGKKPLDLVVLGIHQKGEFKSSVENPKKIEDFYLGVKEVLSSPPTYTRGEHCNRCFKKAVCPAWLDYSKTACKELRIKPKAKGESLVSLSDEKLADFWGMAKTVTSTLKAIEKEMEDRHKSNPTGIFQKHISKRTKVWINPEKLPPKYHEKRVKTPTQAVKEGLSIKNLTTEKIYYKVKPI